MLIYTILLKICFYVFFLKKNPKPEIAKNTLCLTWYSCLRWTCFVGHLPRQQFVFWETLNLTAKFYSSIKKLMKTSLFSEIFHRPFKQPQFSIFLGLQNLLYHRKVESDKTILRDSYNKWTCFWLALYYHNILM